MRCKFQSECFIIVGNQDVCEEKHWDFMECNDDDIRANEDEAIETRFIGSAKLRCIWHKAKSFMPPDGYGRIVERVRANIALKQNVDHSNQASSP